MRSKTEGQTDIHPLFFGLLKTYKMIHFLKTIKHDADTFNNYTIIIKTT